MKKLICFFMLILVFVSAAFAQTGDVSTGTDYDSMIATFAGFAGCVVLLTEGIRIHIQQLIKPTVYLRIFDQLFLTEPFFLAKPLVNLPQRPFQKGIEQHHQMYRGDTGCPSSLCLLLFHSQH